MERETSSINTETMLTPAIIAGQFEKSMMTPTEMKCKRGYRFYYPLRIPGGKGAYEVLQAPAVILESAKSFIKAAYFDETEKIEGKKIKYSLDRCIHFFQNFVIRERKEYVEEVDHLLDHLP